MRAGEVDMAWRGCRSTATACTASRSTRSVPVAVVGHEHVLTVGDEVEHRGPRRRAARPPHALRLDAARRAARLARDDPARRPWRPSPPAPASCCVPMSVARLCTTARTSPTAPVHDLPATTVGLVWLHRQRRPARADHSIGIVRGRTRATRRDWPRPAHQLVASGRPSWKPAADCTPTTARSCSSASEDGTGVRARRADPGADLVDEVLHARALAGRGTSARRRCPPRRAPCAPGRTPTPPTCGSRPRAPRPCRRRPCRRGRRRRARSPGRLVGPGEPRTDHHRGGAGGQRERDVARVPHPTVGPHVLTELGARRGRALEHRGELGTTDAGHHPRRAHRARPDADLDDVGAGLDQRPGALRRRRRCRPPPAPGGSSAAHRAQRLEHPVLVAVRGVDHEAVDAGVEQLRRPSARRRR